MHSAGAEGRIPVMITVMNRRELTITYSMERQAGIRESLNAHGINYQLKLVNRLRSGSFRARMGSLGLNTEAMNEYVFYVHKNDYDRALAVVSGAEH